MSSHRSSSNYYYGNHEQRGYNSRNAPRRPNYQSSRRYDHNVHNDPDAYDASFAEYENIARQFRNRYQTHRFQHLLPYDYPLLPAVVGPYYPHSYYQHNDEAYTFRYVNFWTRLLIGRERYSRFNFRPQYNHDHEEQEDEVLNYLKIRTYHAPAKDGIDSEVVVPDVESDICAICQSEYEHEDNIGALQCGHEYHTDCIKQWLLTKLDCPMCRASVLPSQEQRS